jgi:hypothetical protein
MRDGRYVSLGLLLRILRYHQNVCLLGIRNLEVQ